MKKIFEELREDLNSLRISESGFVNYEDINYAINKSEDKVNELVEESKRVGDLITNQHRINNLELQNKLKDKNKELKDISDFAEEQIRTIEKLLTEKELLKKYLSIRFCYQENEKLKLEIEELKRKISF